MQSVSSRIWTRVAVSISYDDNHYDCLQIIDLQIICISTQLYTNKWAPARLKLCLQVRYEF